MALSSCLHLQSLLGTKGAALGAKSVDSQLGEQVQGMQSVRRLLARPPHLLQLRTFQSLRGLSPKATAKNSEASGMLEGLREPAARGLGDRSPSSVSTSGDPSTRLSAAERRKQRKLNTQPDNEAPEATSRAQVPYSETKQEDHAPVRNGTSQVESTRGEELGIARQSSQPLTRGIDTARRGSPNVYRTWPAPLPRGLIRSGDDELAASQPRRSVTTGEARARQFSDAVRFLNKDTGRPSPAQKPLVQPVIVAKGLLPDSWEGPNGTAILVDKPLKWTSHQACSRLKFHLKLKKIGHAGTLDPMASGLLILVAGPATKLMEVYQAQTKKYTGTIRLGETTPSFDRETEVDERFPWEHITDEIIATTPEGFIGDLMQVPPIYSALQVGGERLYKKARRGETMEIAARPITIEALRLWRDEEVRQHVHFEVVCSKGTYVRSLARDIGSAMGTGAHLVALRRETIGDFDVKDAWDIDDLLAQWQARQDAIRESRIFKSDALRSGLARADSEGLKERTGVRIADG